MYHGHLDSMITFYDGLYDKVKSQDFDFGGFTKTLQYSSRRLETFMKRGR